MAVGPLHWQGRGGPEEVVADGRFSGHVAIRRAENLCGLNFAALCSDRNSNY